MIVCKCCHRVTIAGLTRTEEAFVTKMSKAGKPITDQEMARGVNTSLTALRTRVAGLRRKLQQQEQALGAIIIKGRQVKVERAKVRA